MIERMRMDQAPEAPVAAPQYASQMHGGAPAEPYAVPVGGYELSDGAAAAEVPAGRGRWYWIRWVSAMVLVGLVVGGLIVTLMKFVNGPVSAGATPDSLEAARASVAPTPAVNVLDGKSVMLSYPSIFDTVANKSNDPGAKGDQYYLSSKSASNRGMVVTAFGLATRQLSDDSSYKFRSMHPEQYKPSAVSVGKDQGVLMTKTDNTEVMLFWVHGDRDLNIAITSADPKDDLPGFMRTIIPTIRWKQ